MARLCRASIWIRCRQEDPDAIAGRRRAEGQNELKVLHRCPEDGGRDCNGPGTVRTSRSWREWETEFPLARPGGTSPADPQL